MCEKERIKIYLRAKRTGQTDDLNNEVLKTKIEVSSVENILDTKQCDSLQTPRTNGTRMGQTG